MCQQLPAVQKSAVSNNRKITDKKYTLQLIQVLAGNIQNKNKVKEEDHKHPMMQNTESTSTLHTLQ
jgi:hypothetical protein